MERRAIRGGELTNFLAGLNSESRFPRQTLQTWSTLTSIRENAIKDKSLPSSCSPTDQVFATDQVMRAHQVAQRHKGGHRPTHAFVR